MEYILFDEFITLGKLLKEVDIISSGGAAKHFLVENDVLLNNEYENRRGKKIYKNDKLIFPDLNLEINIIEPSIEDRKEFEEETAEKERVKKIVAKMNKDVKKTQKKPSKPRFPGAK